MLEAFKIDDFAIIVNMLCNFVIKISSHWLILLAFFILLLITKGFCRSYYSIQIIFVYFVLVGYIINQVCFSLLNYMFSAILLLSFNLISNYFVRLYQNWHASPASTSMELITDLHHYVMFYLVKMFTGIKKFRNYLIFSSKLKDKRALLISNPYISPQLVYISEDSFAMLEPELGIYLLIVRIVYMLEKLKLVEKLENIQELEKMNRINYKTKEE